MFGIADPAIFAISTHAPRVRRDLNVCDNIVVKWISTHAPRVRRDRVSLFPLACEFISTHAPRVRRDVSLPALVSALIYFYSRASCEARLDR